MIWNDVSYLNRGSDRQRDAYMALIELDIFSVLADYDPVLTGTFPLGIETPESDLDVVCHAQDLDRFADLVELAYGYLDEFQVRRVEKEGIPSVLCSFRFRNLPIEIFAQPQPSEEQNGYRHMVAEAALLRAGGEDAREAIQRLKDEGLKTEPAFGQYFCLEGDPYEVLRNLADASAEEVDEVVTQAKFARRGTSQSVES